MSEKEIEIFSKLAKVIPKIPEGKKEYLLGVADGMMIATGDAKVDSKMEQEEEGNE